MKIDSKLNADIVTKSKKFKTEPYTFDYNFKDTILYNLAVGASADAENLR